MSVVAIAAAPLLAAIVIDDVRRHRIRNDLVLAVATLVGLGVVLIAIGGDENVLARAVAGAGLAAAPLAMAWVARPAQIGGGDVKFAAVLGALVGATDPWLAVVAVGGGLTMSLVVALALRRARLPLAPTMAFVALAVVALSAAV